MKKGSQYIDEKVFYATYEFDFDDPAAKLICNKYKSGILRAGSIGFHLIESSDEPILEKQKGSTIKKWELYEYSCCNVPVDQNSLSQNNDLRGTYVEEYFDFRAQMMEMGYWDSKWDAIRLQGGEIVHIRSVVPFKSFPLAEEGTQWSFSVKDEDALLGDPPDWRKYRKAFAWYDIDNSEIKKGYKLPHHKIIDGEIKTVWRGVVSAMGALLGARGGVDIPDEERNGVYNHLRRHYEEFEKEAPEFRSYGMLLKDLDKIQNEYSALLTEQGKIKTAHIALLHQCGDLKRENLILKQTLNP
jgi:hypothetical protein